MKIDTHIRHVTRSDANLFLELGFSEEEAQQLYLTSEKQINDATHVKEKHMSD